MASHKDIARLRALTETLRIQAESERNISGMWQEEPGHPMITGETLAGRTLDTMHALNRLLDEVAPETPAKLYEELRKAL